MLLKILKIELCFAHLMFDFHVMCLNLDLSMFLSWFILEFVYFGNPFTFVIFVPMT
jgi:hypothetical protein